jgi:murein DD-endopeptidase MepM/ murein hydrolase activator NlpD
MAREILIRTDGRVRYITLSSRLQVSATLFSLIVLAWVGFSSVGVLVKELRLSTFDDEREKAKVAYIDMLNDLADYYDQFATLADKLDERRSGVAGLVDRLRDGRPSAGSLRELVNEANPSSAAGGDDMLAYETGLTRILDLNKKMSGNAGDLKRRLKTSEQALTGNIAELKERLRLSEEEAERIEEMRERITRQLEGGQRRLATASDESGNLAITLEVLRTRLGDAEKNETDFARHQAGLNAQIASLARQLDATRDARGQIEARVSTLSRQLTSTGNDKEALEKEVVSLRADFGMVREERDRLVQQMDSVQETLAAAIGQRNALQSARAELSGRVTELEERLAMIEVNQDGLFHRIVERTREGVDGIEKIVAMTGVDVERVVRRARDELAVAKGGPFVPVMGQGEGVSEAMLASVANLDDEVERWEHLQLVLRSMPLTAPVDQYSVGSRFGKRKDPFNGRLGMHEGFDMAAPSGTPILSTAPGKVVFAGWRGNYGRMVEVDHGLGIRTLYAHMKAIAVEKGDVVDYRQKIGLVGSSGRSTGPHVHFEIRIDGIPLDPVNFLKAGRYVFKG